MVRSFYGGQLKLGILGGGQLGRMLIQEAANLDVHISILDPTADAPCAEIAHDFSVGDFNDYDAVMAFGKDKDILTVEIEHVNTKALADLKGSGVKVYPDPHVLDIIKDKGSQKNFFRVNKIATSPYYLVDSETEISGRQEGKPCVQKLRTGGYDGRGVKVLRNESDFNAMLKGPSLVEQLVDIEKEISCIVARNEHGETAVFPPVEMVFDPEANLVDYLLSPAILTDDQVKTAEDLALKVGKAFDSVGIFAVEMFLNTDGEIWVNEVAPRPHNSGHQSIEGNITSQYGQHLRAILGLPLGNTSITSPSAMVNLLGEEGHTGPVKYDGIEKILSWPGVYPHLYGKTHTKPFRKMGHVTVIGDSIDEVLKLKERVKSTVKVISA